MRVLRNFAAGAAVSLSIVTPAFAQSTLLSEPSDLSLLALGVIGVVLGQRGARKASR